MPGTGAGDRLVFALGGGVDGPCWLHLPEGLGPSLADRFGADLLDLDENVRIERLHASSETGSLEVPGEVGPPGETTLGEILAIVADELGPGAVVHDLRLALAGGIAVECRGGRSVRLEAPSDASFPARLERLTGLDPVRAGALLAWIRAEALTERALSVTVEERAMRVAERTPGADRVLPVGGERIEV